MIWHDPQSEKLQIPRGNTINERIEPRKENETGQSMLFSVETLQQGIYFITNETTAF